MGLKKALRALNNAVTDLSSLHVQTYTGKVTIDLTQDGATKVDKLRETLMALDADGEVQLVAEALYQFDGDSYNFLASADVSPAALEMHQAAVEAGIQTRQGLADLVTGIFDKD